MANDDNTFLARSARNLSAMLSAVTPVAIVGLVSFGVAVAAVAMVAMALGVAQHQAAALGVVCVGSLAPFASAVAFSLWQAHRYTSTMADLYAASVQELPRVRVLPVPQLPPPAAEPVAAPTDRWVQTGADEWRDADTLRRHAARAYDLLWREGLQPSQTNLKARLGITDNTTCTAVCEELARRGLVVKGGGKTSPWQWARTCPTVAEVEQGAQ